MQHPPFPGWRDFIAGHWEAGPASFRDPDSGLCDEPAVFDGLKLAAEELRTGIIRDHRDVSFHLDKTVVVDPGPYLPRRPDSLTQYLARLESLVAGQPFTLLVNNFQEFSPRLCFFMRLFARNLFEQLGWLPAGTVSSHVMLARYAVSPFGVHKDPNSVFTFIIRGTKALRVWPFAAFADRARQPFAEHRQLNLYDLDYRPFKGAGIALAGRPGDVLYWPSTYWHVGEASDESVHISLHLTFDLHSEPRGEVVDLLQRVVEGSLSEADWHSGYPVENLRAGGPVQPPEQLMCALRGLTRAAEEIIEDSVKALWLSKVSAQGFWSLARPARADSPALDAAQTKLRADPTFPVYWMISGGSVTLAAHGQVIRFPRRAWTDQLLSALAERRTFRISELAPQATKVREEVAAVATKLVAIGAIQVVGEPCSITSS